MVQMDPRDMSEIANGRPRMAPSKLSFRYAIVRHGLVAKRDATNEKDLGQVAQAELIAQAPEHHGGETAEGILCPVRQARGVDASWFIRMASVNTISQKSSLPQPLQSVP